MREEGGRACQDKRYTLWRERSNKNDYAEAKVAMEHSTCIQTESDGPRRPQPCVKGLDKG